jgi:hypothetical protein
MGKLRSSIWKIAVILVILAGMTYGVSLLSGPDFWDQFTPQFLATIFGIVITLMLTYIVLQYQENAQKALRRTQLIADLRAEVSENLKRLADLQTFLHPAANTSEGNLRVQGLREAVMKYSLTPENVILLQSPDLADEIEWVVKQCEEFDQTLGHCFEQYLSDIALGPQPDWSSEIRTRFWDEISPHVEFIRLLLKQLNERLTQYANSSR